MVVPSSVKIGSVFMLRNPRLTSTLDGDEWSTSRPECFNTVWTLRRREKSFAHAGNRTTIPPLFSPWIRQPEVSGQHAKNLSMSLK